MRSVAMAMLLVLFGASFMVQVSLGAVYKVGDTKRWTALGNPDYKKWAETKNFHVGDTILFEYNQQYHNVLQVTHDNYRSCNAASPIATYTSGNDSIAITSHGHHFFICGVPGHCQAGQKVDINVHLAGPSLNVTPSSSPVAPAPAPSNAPSVYMSGAHFVKLGIAVAVVFTVVMSKVV